MMAPAPIRDASGWENPRQARQGCIRGGSQRYGSAAAAPRPIQATISRDTRRLVVDHAADSRQSATPRFRSLRATGRRDRQLMDVEAANRSQLPHPG